MLNLQIKLVERANVACYGAFILKWVLCNASRSTASISDTKEFRAALRVQVKKKRKESKQSWMLVLLFLNKKDLFYVYCAQFTARSGSHISASNLLAMPVLSSSKTH